MHGGLMQNGIREDIRELDSQGQGVHPLVPDDDVAAAVQGSACGPGLSSPRHNLGSTRSDPGDDPATTAISVALSVHGDTYARAVTVLCLVTHRSSHSTL